MAERLGQRWQWARINAMATDIRLSIAEAYPFHQCILDWSRSFSPAGIPATAVGVDGLTRRLMRWAMREWKRQRFLNRYLAGTPLPRPALCP